jgi:hypothetical protein
MSETAPLDGLDGTELLDRGEGLDGTQPLDRGDGIGGFVIPKRDPSDRPD